LKKKIQKYYELTGDIYKDEYNVIYTNQTKNIKLN